MAKRMDYGAVAPDGIKALSHAHDYVANCGLPRSLIDLAYLRASQINGCAYCIDLHCRDLMKDGMPVEKVLLVSVWHEAEEAFTARERAALAWSECVTRVAETSVPDDDYRAVAQVFSEKELADLTIAISLMNAYNRLAISFRRPPASLKRLAAAA